MKRARFDGPLGPMLLVASDTALCGLYFAGQKYYPPASARWPEAEDDALLSLARRQLTEYFAGTRLEFDLPLAPAGTPWQRVVWEALCTVPYGKTISYGELAKRLGRPGSARAAGAAVGRNPLSIVIPCHRVIGATGQLTGYAGGLDRKRALLALEAGGQMDGGDASGVPPTTP
jgi:methylated-DNA-[protein]-cysteine S-methyltransferase